MRASFSPFLSAVVLMKHIGALERRSTADIAAAAKAFRTLLQMLGAQLLTVNFRSRAASLDALTEAIFGSGGGIG